MSEISERVAELPAGWVQEMLTPRHCSNCKRGKERDVTYRFLRADGSYIIELCPRCMAWSLLENVLKADQETT